VHSARSDHVRRLINLTLRVQRERKRERILLSHPFVEHTLDSREVIGTQVTAAFHARLPYVCMAYQRLHRNLRGMRTYTRRNMLRIRSDGIVFNTRYTPCRLRADVVLFALLNRKFCNVLKLNAKEMIFINL